MKNKFRLIIDGGVPLTGTLRISGSKNSALPSLFATLLTDDECILENVPDLDNIDTTCSLLNVLGKKVVRNPGRITVLKGKNILTEAPYDLVRRMRASILVLGPLLARRGRASASLPGGCAIGMRPINIHLSGFEALGARFEVSKGVVRLKSKRLAGNRVRLAFPSVGATENLLMAAVLAQGKTVISNAAREPEIVDCADLLNKMGAGISGAGTGTISVYGKEKLHGACHAVIPDRIETSTYLLAAAATGGRLKLTGTRSSHIRSVLEVLVRAGAKIRIENDPLRDTESILCAAPKIIKPVSVVTGPYPAFPTDVQAQWMALMSLSKGKCTVRESVFENRFLHAAELCRMGASIEIRGQTAIVTGVKDLSGTQVMVSDLRAGAAMVIAGLAAKGRTVVQRIYHLDRGYEKLEENLRAAGARIKRD